MASFPHPVGNKSSWPLVFPNFLAEKHPGKGKILGGKWCFGALLLGQKEQQEQQGCRGSACVAVWDLVTHGDPRVGMSCAHPLAASPLPSPSLRFMDLEQSNANPLGAARATGKKGQACAGSCPPAQQPRHQRLQEHSNPEEAQAGKKPGAKLKSGSCSPTCITLVHWHACVQLPMQMCVSMRLCKPLDAAHSCANTHKLVRSCACLQAPMSNP